MSNNVKVEVLGKDEIVGRLIGFADDKACTALINSEDAPKKVFTSESTTIRENIGKMSGKRFVIAVKGNIPSLFVSPKVKSISWCGGIPELHCEDNKAYKFIETK